MVIRYLQCASHLHDKRITVCSVSNNYRRCMDVCVLCTRCISCAKSPTEVRIPVCCWKLRWIWLRIHIVCKKCQMSTFAFTAHLYRFEVRTGGYILLQYRNENPNPNPMKKILILTPAIRLIIFKTIPQTNINNQITMLTRLSVKTLSNHSTARVVAMRPFSIVNDLYKKVSIWYYPYILML